MAINITLNDYILYKLLKHYKHSKYYEFAKPYKHSKYYEFTKPYEYSKYYDFYTYNKHDGFNTYNEHDGFNTYNEHDGFNTYNEHDGFISDTYMNEFHDYSKYNNYNINRFYYIPYDNFLVTLTDYKLIEIEDKYKKLLNSGMFFEFHPELTGNWDEDKNIINNKMF